MSVKFFPISYFSGNLFLTAPFPDHCLLLPFQMFDSCICIYDMFMCEMFLKIVISIYLCVYVVIKFLINK